MPSLPLDTSQIFAAAPATGKSCEEIRQHVRTLLMHAEPEYKSRERRSTQRHPYPYPIELTPVDRDGLPTGQIVTAIGKHLSEGGLDFYCTSPLPHRRVIAALKLADGERFEFLVDLTWCRFAQSGWYENGGRFLKVVRPASEIQASRERFPRLISDSSLL